MLSDPDTRVATCCNALREALSVQDNYYAFAVKHNKAYELRVTNPGPQQYEVT